MYNQNGFRFENKADAPHAERFFPIEECCTELTQADALDSHYGPVMTEAKRLMCEKLKAAEIGGFYIFDDGSELPK